VALNKSSYVQKMEELGDIETYTVIAKNPTPSIEKNHNIILFNII